ncbi:MAG: DNA repair protein RadA [bacterium]
MEKRKTRFLCQNCGYVSFKWLGRCPECGEWDSISEEKLREGVFTRGLSLTPSKPVSIREIERSTLSRYLSGIDEFDRILGGGAVPGSLILVGGEPGIGKSTLLLQTANRLSSPKSLVLYISGEESIEQSKLRATRLGVDSAYLYVSSETNLEEITQQIDDLKPKIVIIDSIQTVYREDYSSAPGSVSQVRESTAYLMRLAKQKKITIFLIGHVTKEGAIAGPRVLEHIVDTVLYFESGKDYRYRILRAVKNRFGPTSEIGIFGMEEDGIKEILDSSKLFLGDPSLDRDGSGTAVVPTVEGSRSFLVEIQALVTSSTLAIPRRVTQGMDYNRLCLLLAVLEKRGEMRFYNQDVYLNVAGGMRVDEPACDLAIVLAISSSFKNKPFLKRAVAIGEIGLAGEIRPVEFMEKRLEEAKKLGFSQCLIPYFGSKEIKIPSEMKLIKVRSVKEALERGTKEL